MLSTKSGRFPRKTRHTSRIAELERLGVDAKCRCIRGATKRSIAAESGMILGDLETAGRLPGTGVLTFSRATTLFLWGVAAASTVQGSAPRLADSAPRATAN